MLKSDNTISDNILSMIKKEVKENSSIMSKNKKKKRVMLMKTKLVNSILANTISFLLFIFQSDLRKMNEDEVLEWLDLGLGITDDLNNFRMDGKVLVQKTIEELTRGPQKVSMESALKIHKAISKASERDAEDFSIKHAEVLRADKYEPIGNFIKAGNIIYGSVWDSIKSMFGGDFLNVLKSDQASLGPKQSKWKLSEDEALIYESFLRSTWGGTYGHKVFKPFITRAPADYFKSKDFLTRILSVLKKFPAMDEGTYCFLSKRSLADFKIGETWVLPSFTLGTKLGSDNIYSDDEKYIPQGSLPFIPKYDFTRDTEIRVIYKGGSTMLKISGKTNRGYELKTYRKGN